MNKEQLLQVGPKAGLVVFGVAAVALLLAIMQYPNTSAFGWIVPIGIISVYVLFNMWTAAINTKTKKPALNIKNQLTWKQLVVQLVTYFTLYFVTTGLLRASVGGYNELFSVAIAVVYFFAVPMALSRFFWTKK